MSSKLCRAAFHRSRLLCAVLILSDELSVVYIEPVLQTKAKSRLVTGAIAFIWVAVPAFQISVACLSTDLTLPYRTSPYPLSHLASPNLPHFRRVEAIHHVVFADLVLPNYFILSHLPYLIFEGVEAIIFSQKTCLNLPYLTLSYPTYLSLPSLGSEAIRFSQQTLRYVTLPYLT